MRNARPTALLGPCVWHVRAGGSVAAFHKIALPPHRTVGDRPTRRPERSAVLQAAHGPWARSASWYGDRQDVDLAHDLTPSRV